jgi:hypothetical protein
VSECDSEAELVGVGVGVSRWMGACVCVCVCVCVREISTSDCGGNCVRGCYHAVAPLQTILCAEQTCDGKLCTVLHSDLVVIGGLFLPQPR